MIERIKLWYYNKKTWIYNTQYILYSMLMLGIVILIDLKYYNIYKYIPNLFFTKVSLAKTILATLAGAQLTITTFTFSTILSVMSNYMSNYSPRVMENFVEEKITMKVLGIFFGGFFYSITALLLMRNLSEDELVIAGFVAVAYALISMVYFIIFVQKVIYSSKSENLISDISKETLKVIEEEIDKRTEYQGFFTDTDKDTSSFDLYPNKNGFLSLIDFNGLSNLLKNTNCELVIDCKVGDYLNLERPLAHINRAKKYEFDDELMKKLADKFLLIENKVYENDYRHGIDKISEIAIRALSPGINDPNTAVYCIYKMGFLLTYLSKSSSRDIVYKVNENVRIAYTSHSFEEDLYYTFNQIIHYGKDDPDVIYPIFESLETLYHSATKINKEIILDFVRDIYENIMVKPKGSLSIKKIDDIYNRINTEMKTNSN